MALLDVSSLTVQFSPEEGPVFSHLSFSIEKGDFFVICGMSGSGKTSLLKCLAGFMSPEKGEIFFRGERIVSPGIAISDPDRIMVFQSFNQLFPWKSVAGNVAFALKYGRRESGQNIKAVEHFLQLVGLDHAAEKFPYQLSGGMKQRIAVARALAAGPSLLLMDEPFGSVDAGTRKELQAMLLRIWQETGTTIVFVTHDIQEAVFLSDSILVLNGENNVVPNPLSRPRVGESVLKREFSHKIFDLLKKI